MPLTELLEASTTWFAWAGIGLGVLTLISFLAGWGIKFRLVGTTVFTLLLAGSTWAFTASYSPPFKVEGAKYAPVVYDNGIDLIVAQASQDFPKEAIQPTLEQIAGNLKGAGRDKDVHIRLRQVQPFAKGISNPVVLGEVIRDIRLKTTFPITKPNNNHESTSEQTAKELTR